MFSSCKGSHHHNECGFREMEVGDDGIDHFPLVSRIDIKLRPVAATLEISALAGRFQRADGRRAYAMILLPSSLALLIFSAVSSLTVYHSLCIS